MVKILDFYRYGLGTILVGELRSRKPHSQEKEKLTKYLSNDLRFLDRKVPEI